MEALKTPTINTGLLSAARAGRFTASEIHKLMSTPRQTKEIKERIAAGEVIFGETAKSYIAEKAWEILSAGRNSAPLGRAAERGNDMESVAFELLVRHWTPLAKVYVDDGFLPYGDCAGATPDAFAHNGKADVDIKVPWVGGKLLEFARDVKDDAPETLKDFSPEYFWQKQLQTMATGGDAGYLAYFDDRWINTKADVSDFTGLPYTQFKGDGFAFVARRIPLMPESVVAIDRVLAAAKEERDRLVTLFAESM